MKSLQQLVWGMGLTLLAGLAAAQPGPAEKITLDIPAQPIEEALNEFAKQAGVQILFYSDVVVGVNAPPLKGSYTQDAALQELLAQTSLRYEFVNERTVAIRAKVGEAAAGKISAAQSQESFRVAQAQETAAGSAAGVQGASGEPPSSPPGEKLELEEVVVTGTHIRGAAVTTSPVTVLDRAYIDSTGIGTTTGLIESLPQNFALANQSGVLTPGVSNASAQGSSINLRGIGEGTTLTLINGRRMALGFLGNAADISALPLSAIERVEVLMDGASALYGSDAVGGVVNFILRRDFNGAETRLRSGWADGDVNEFRVSQALGHTWDSGNALLSVEYYKRDLLASSERDFVPATADIGSLFPQDKNRSALFSGRQELSQAVSLFADVLYTDRDSYNEAGRIAFAESAMIDNPQVQATAGIDWQTIGDWQIETAATYARNKLRQQFTSLSNGLANSRFTMRELQVKADGSMFDLWGGRVRAAIGVDWRSEDYSQSTVFDDGFIGVSKDKDQIVRSAFGELSLPIVGAQNARPGIQRLDVSIAGRFDDYSAFGSSFDPKLAIMWEPVSGLRFHGGYGTSYVAPKLFYYSSSSNVTFAGTTTDAGAPGGVSRQIQVFGIDVASLTAQESENFSFGFEFTPRAVQGLKVGLTYYDIDYTGKIAQPVQDPAVMLADPQSFGALVIRNPTPDEVAAVVDFGRQGQGFFDCDFDPVACDPDPNFNPASIAVIVDNSIRNLSEVATSGLDLSLQYDFAAAIGDIHLSFDGSYILEREQRTTATSALFETVDTIYNPPDWRARASFGWQRRGWAANLFVNHVDAYVDNRALLPAPVASYTTVDGRLAYDFKERLGSGFFAGVLLSASVQNLFDRDPPRTQILNIDNDAGFDSTNANPMGRFFAVELTKTWGGR